MSSAVMTSTEITQYHIHLAKQLNALCADIQKKADSKTTIKTCQVGFTLFINSADKGWEKHVVQSSRINKLCIPLVLPANDKKLVTFLRVFAQREPTPSNPLEVTLPVRALQKYDKAGGTNAKTKVLTEYRLLNSTFANENDILQFLEEFKGETFRIFNGFTSERFGLEIQCTFTILNMNDPTKKETITLTQDLKQECTTCKGWRTTASALNECTGCLKELPNNTPTGLHKGEDFETALQSEFQLAWTSFKALNS